MKNLPNIKAQITSGDIRIICEVTGYSRDTVDKVLLGQRNNNRVVELCEHAIECRKEAKEKIKQLNQQLLTQF